jgi:hypothetical protein
VTPYDWIYLLDRQLSACEARNEMPFEIVAGELLDSAYNHALAQGARDGTALIAPFPMSREYRGIPFRADLSLPPERFLVRTRPPTSF